MLVAVVSRVDVVANGLVSILTSERVDCLVVRDVAAAAALRASVLVYDVSDGRASQLQGLDAAVGLGVPVVVVVAERRPELLAGIAVDHRVGVVSVSMSARTIVDVVATAASGRSQPSAIPVDGVPGLILSAREAQVLVLIGQGLSNNEIAGRLFLSINSVKTYVRTLYRKIGVVRRSQAVVWAARHGFAPELPETAADAQRTQ
jgi:DNA-binding CsgD family transcriptional regulator